MVNHLVFECGHRFPEFPSKLKKLKRALSIRRALSNKAKVPKDIPREGLCKVCAEYSVQDFLAGATQTQYSNKTFADLQQERVAAAIAAAQETAEREEEEAEAAAQRAKTSASQHQIKRKPVPQQSIERNPVPQQATRNPNIRFFDDDEESQDTEWLLAKDHQQ
ncbi:hypothetical protein BCIN_15g01770 [Botrytis cinerea B05.10]|uniref:Uncharacterized protein n=2 Tax=Botryotinia fuckeliana TaxID=40559 RepID=A0A384K466_BOTFB|nr:hypothetical protein BCIN_15g01770 [Botrytis cinerea B05.10]ATZ57620.1 hypothetical protein BCIN_15g01770 [Botrytis cinerea B05.10]CCD47418.1 hypothetical protein BofuT4_P005770.1 [Botrytis cinerea T4]